MADKVWKILNSVCEGWIPEFRFDSVRRFKFDYGHLKMKIAVEMEGGIYTGTGHTKIGRYLSDMQKYNMAQLRGWIVLRYGYGQEKLITNDVKKAESIMAIEDRIDSLSRELRESHIKRLNAGQCSAATGTIFMDIISNFERIGDHAVNVAEVVLKK